MAFDRLLGEAYILMRADGTLIPRDVRDAGKKAAKGYSKEFDKELKSAEKGSISRFRQSLATATNDIDFSRFRKEFGSIDQTVDGVNERLRELRTNNLLTKKQAKQVSASLKEWADSARGVAAETKRVADSGKRMQQFFKDQEEGLKRLGKARQREAAVVRASSKAYETYTHNIQFSATREQRALADQNKAWLTYGRNVEHTLTRNERAIRDQNAAWLTYGRNIIAGAKSVENVAKSTEKAVVSNHKLVRGFHSLRDATDKFVIRADKAAEVFGRGFGKGSRNNFVNFVGSTVGGLARLATGIVTFPVKLVAHITDSFTSGFTTARDAGAGFFKATAKGLLSVVGGFKGIAGGVVAIAGGAIAFGKVLPGLIGQLSQLVGVASALVGSVGIGLTGALLAALPALGGLVAGLGAVGVAFYSFFGDKKKKQLIADFTKPIKELGKKFKPQVEEFLGTFKGGLGTLFKDLTPSVDAFFRSWKKNMTDPTTRKGLDAISASIGRIATTFNTALPNLLSGLVGFFQPILPYSERLATSIGNAFKTFDKWANSAGGHNSIAEFMHNAWIDAKLVWDILGQIGGIFATVFSAGDTTGATFLTGIRDKLSEINAILKTPEGRAKLDKWFGSVADIGKGLGDIALSMGTIIKDFNDPSAQSSARDLMNSLVSIGNAAESIAAAADAVGRIVDFLSNPAIAGLNEVVRFITGVDPRHPVIDTSGIKPGSPTPAPTPLTNGKGPVVPGPRVDAKLTVNGFEGAGAVDQAMYAIGLTPRQVETLAGYVVPINMDTKTYEATTRIIEAFRFTGKQVPVAGNTAAWDVTKGTVAGYAFDTKTVTIDANAKPLKSTIDKVREWLRSLPANKQIRIAGVNGQGGIPITAMGGVFHGNQIRRIAEAGPEAVVPLRRPLNLVDPSVRALSAIAQGLKPPAMAAGGTVGTSGPSIIVQDGAVQVTTAATSPQATARVVLNSLGDALAAVG